MEPSVRHFFRGLDRSAGGGRGPFPETPWTDAKPVEFPADLAHDGPELRSRGLDPETCRDRRIGRVVAPGDRYDGWLAFTVFDIAGRAVGRTYRSRKGRRWSNPRGFPEGRHLYNLDRAWPSLIAVDAAVIVEGPFDALHLHRAGWTNAVALLGNRLTGWHVDLLLTVGVGTVVLLLDNDHGGRLGTRWARDDDGRLDQFRVVDLHRALPPGRDPDQLDADRLDALLAPYRPPPPPGCSKAIATAESRCNGREHGV